MQANVNYFIINKCLFSLKLHISTQLIHWWLHASEHPLHSYSVVSRHIYISYIIYSYVYTYILCQINYYHTIHIDIYAMLRINFLYLNYKYKIYE